MNNIPIDRVILVLNDNPLYLDFWNYSSKIWKVNFGVTPTLFFVGKPSIKLTEQFGEVYILPEVNEVIVNRSRDWSVTWALFWGAAQFKDDVCVTHGIDQAPLSDRFFKSIKKYDFNKDYVIGLADAYSIPNWYVSSHHVAKGSIFKEALSVQDRWQDEVKSVFSYRNNYGSMYNTGDFWGLDELHSSFLLKNFPDIKLHNGFKDLSLRRIDRAYDPNFDPDLLSQGYYSEIHAHRPYIKYKIFLDKISDLCPIYTK